ncbi:hypothetical protein [Hyalangium rubrum]|uniref:Uncharacterized protein n=1 Tax=Hyalangium rubrum TaxID=3103134 RepID=A0ABU5H5G5_9BACT|nr:hypothetical protein [Hyalangium sp. s54d21]MDY7228724.1 hypothetical protein [Hyalangium sp. s54d21]
MNKAQQTRSLKSSGISSMNSMGDVTPHDHGETEPPPEPKRGKIVLRTDVVSIFVEVDINDSTGAASWPEDSGAPRELMIVPLPDGEEFLAFGLVHEATISRVSFVAWGLGRDQLELLMDQLSGDADSVTFYAQPPQQSLQTYISTYFPSGTLHASSLQWRVKGLIRSAFLS